MALHMGEEYLINLRVVREIAIKQYDMMKRADIVFTRLYQGTF